MSGTSDTLRGSRYVESELACCNTPVRVYVADGQTEGRGLRRCRCCGRRWAYTVKDLSGEYTGTELEGCRVFMTGWLPMHVKEEASA